MVNDGLRIHRPGVNHNLQITWPVLTLLVDNVNSYAADYFGSDGTYLKLGLGSHAGFCPR